MYEDGLKEFFDSCEEDIRFAPLLVFTTSNLGCEISYPDPTQEACFLDTYVGICAVFVEDGRVRTVAAVETVKNGLSEFSKLKIFGGDLQLANASFFLKREYEILTAVSHEREIISLDGITLSKNQFEKYIEGLKCKVY